IIGFTDIVLDTELQPKQRAHMNTIRQSARSLLGLLNDILDSSKFESGKVILEKVDFNIQIIADHVADTLSVNAQKRGLTLSTKYAEGMPLYYKGDPLRLSQILINLIGNAIKFTERGSINIMVSYESNELHLQIQDTGIGMTPEQTAKVFEAFTQADASINRRFGGTGLGTTISRQIVEAMNGRIDVESQLGEGTTFHVYLPLELGVYVPEQQKNRVMVLPELNILIADDIEQNLELLALVLERKGHKVVAANNGLEAFALFKEQAFDVILMDVNMPEVDGLQSTRLIRAYEQEHGLKAIPIVALTASVLASDRQLTEQAGMNGFAVKPLDPPALFEEIARILNIEPQFEAAAVQAVAPTVAHSGAIDWEHGLSLWGSKAKLIPKIAGFIETIEQENWDEKDNEQLAFTLHSIKGVAGNLGLMSLSHWAGINEAKARQGDILDVHNLAMLAHDFITEIKLLLAKEASSAMPDEEAAAKQQRADLPELLSKLKEKLDTCELDDALLEQILPCLEPADGQHLQSALDA
ncbi:MAG: ATP-binding protein, partial [Venatoribacter sp.]